VADDPLEGNEPPLDGRAALLPVERPRGLPGDEPCRSQQGCRRSDPLRDAGGAPVRAVSPFPDPLPQQPIEPSEHGPAGKEHVFGHTERLREILPGPALSTDDGVGGHGAPLEPEGTVQRRLQKPERRHNSDGQARRLFRDEKGREALSVRPPSRHGEHQEHVRQRAVGEPCLLAVEHVAIAAFDGPRSDFFRVTARLRLRQGDGDGHVPRCHCRKDLPLLADRGAFRDDRFCSNEVNRPRQGDAGPAAFAHEDVHRRTQVGIPGPCAAERGRDAPAQKAPSAHGCPEARQTVPFPAVRAPRGVKTRKGRRLPHSHRMLFRHRHGAPPGSARPRTSRKTNAGPS